jgi:monoamine oxidase
LKEAIRPDNNNPLFLPSLSEEKLEAIESMHVGPYKKVFLTFTKTFWSETQGFIGMLDESCSGPLGQYLLVDNLWASRGIPCMEVILLNEQADWATHKSTEEIVDVVLSAMEFSMGVNDLRGLLLDSHVTRWEEDPYSRGAYSSYTLGVKEEHTDALAAPEWDGKLFFCGEATTSQFEGSVHAALITAERAVKELLLKKATAKE